MISFNDFLIESKKKKHLHLFEDGEMTFGEIRNIVDDIFSKDIISIYTKKPEATVLLTCVNGKILGVLDGLNPRKPITVEKIVKGYNGSTLFKEAMLNTLNAIEKKLSKLNIKELDEIFDNGHRFIKIQILSTPTLENPIFFKKYKHCFPIISGITKYDDNFEQSLTESDTDINNRVIEFFSIVNNKAKNCKSNLDPFSCDGYKLSEIAEECISNCPNRKEILREVSQLLNELTDGLGYRATLNDYIKERYERRIVNAATKSGLEIRRSSEFVSELVDRLSSLSAKRPTINDLTTYAKKDKIDIKSKEYKDFLNMIESAIEVDNYEMLKPISKLLNRIIVLFLKSIAGYICIYDTKLQNELSLVLGVLESDGEMTESNLIILKKLFTKIHIFEKTHKDGDSLTIVKNNKPYTIKCKMPCIESFGKKILKI